MAPKITAAMAVATLAIIGTPLTSGFFSKDAIIEAAFHGGHIAIFAFLSLAALATCLYSGRMIRLVFLGEANSEEASHAHESPWTMTLPLVVLGLGYSVAGGFLAHALIPAGSLQPIGKALGEVAFHLTAPSTIVGLLSLVLGFLAILLLRELRRKSSRRVRLRPPHAG